MHSSAPASRAYLLRVDYEAFVNDVTAQAQFGGPNPAKRAIEAVMHALARALDPRVAHEIADRLPSELGQAMRGVSEGGVTNASEFYAHVGERAGLSLSQGLEQTQIVCAVLVKRLDPSVKGKLSRELPDEIAQLFAESDRLSSPPPARPRANLGSLAAGRPGAAHSLSAGRPGSSHPLSEAAPKTTQTHSVAEADPHEDSKISSAQGLTQQREGDSLSEAKGPGRNK